MRNSMLSWRWPLTLMLLVTAGSAAMAEETSFQELEWNDLIPDGEKAIAASTLTEPDGMMEQSLPTALSPTLVSELDGKSVKLPGFIVPLESDEVGMLSEFFLVPYFGACIHVPPPPPNQLVYVKLKEPFELKSLWDPFWVSGTMRARGYESSMGQAGYTLETGQVAPYEWPE